MEDKVDSTLLLEHGSLDQRKSCEEVLVACASSKEYICQ